MPPGRRAPFPRVHEEDIAYLYGAGRCGYTRVVTAAERTPAQVEWYRELEANKIAGECVLRTRDLGERAPESRILDAFEATDVRYGLYKYLSPSDIKNVHNVFGEFAPDLNTIRRNGFHPHLLKDIFPGEQYEKVKFLMSEGMGFTLIGAGIHDFLERNLDSEVWEDKYPGKKIHLLLLVTPSKKEDLPARTIRQSKPDIKKRLFRQQNYMRVNGRYHPIHSKVGGEIFVETEELLAMTQFPGEWYDYTRPVDHDLGNEAARKLAKSLHKASRANRKIFSHQSYINQRGNLLKLDVADYLVVEWIQPKPDLQKHRQTRDQAICRALASPHDFVDQDKFDHNNYLFVHLRRDLSMRKLLSRQPPRVEYLNLHEDLWHVRKADMERRLPPEETSSHNPHHKVFLSFAYCLPKQDYVLTKPSRNSAISGVHRNPGSPGSSLYRGRGVWRWKSERRLSVAASFGGLHSQAVLSIFACENDPAFPVDPCCAMQDGTPIDVLTQKDWFRSKTSLENGPNLPTDPEVISMRRLSSTMNLPIGVHYDDSSKGLRFSLAKAALPHNFQALLTLEGRLAFEYTSTTTDAQGVKIRTFSIPGVNPIDRHSIRPNLFEKHLHASITQGPP